MKEIKEVYPVKEDTVPEIVIPEVTEDTTPVIEEAGNDLFADAAIAEEVAASEE